LIAGVKITAYNLHGSAPFPELWSLFTPNSTGSKEPTPS